ncbi:MAG: PepSY-like domain-containing protein [Bacteroides sp.]|nr:PepSY-like domain-containing protein [Bacteroides sp.]MCM1378680.1 PepSY-like domain-containing protein [Bacteroides sp.]MCM1444953.1 PepSY-like domain-containing protein [Prevotella sp.]
MKKNLIILLMLALCTLAAQARETIHRDIAALPATAQKFIQSNFKNSAVSFIKVDSTLGFTTEYEVVFTDGTEIDFDSAGTWDKIEMPRNKAVPSALVPKAIADYVNKNFSGQKIVSIDKESRSYDIELSSGLDLVFDRAGNFKKIDD